MDRIPRNVADWKTSGAVHVDGVAWGGTGAIYSVGHVPYYAEVFYFGAVALMPPREYLRLALTMGTPRQSSLAYQRESLRTGRPVAPPFLRINRLPDGRMAVTGHEGRHRAMALAMDEPNALLPVALIGGGELRARDIGPEQFDAWTTSSIFLDQDKNEAGPVDFRVIYHKPSGKVWARPGFDLGAPQTHQAATAAP